MRFGELLRVTVLASAGSATLLATVTILSVGGRDDPVLVYVSLAWWLSAVVLGLRLGRGDAATQPIRRLLAEARHQPGLPELRPASTLLNRLWALLAVTFVAGALAFVIPQVASIAAGFAIIWALAWRRQNHAVTAIEERDGVRFYVDRTSPFAPIRLIRTPGFRSD